MKKSVKIIVHASFWILIPLIDVLSKWADAYDVLPGFESLPNLSFSKIIIEKVSLLFTPVDVGRPITDVSNLIGIVFNLCSYLIIPIGVFYLFYGFFVPKIVKNRKARAYIKPVLFVLFAPLMITTLFKFFTIAVAWKFTYCVTLTYIVTIVFGVLGTFFYIVENWFSKEKLAKQNLQSELALLKNQINPHFLFNTLNNIDSLIKSNVDRASETLVKLSAILRYMIYDTNVDKALLSNEIKHIESYVDLQKIQYANKELVSLSIQGNVDNLMISPMLFIPFVENAFKHCNVKNIQNAIRINFAIDSKIVNFECINLFDKTQKIAKDNASGIGLNIIKRRLELLYADRHTLMIHEADNNFRVSLSINTDEN
jgi:two-component system, LytTR family, sensor kinase